MEIMRKTPLQLEALEQLYLENTYPTRTAMEDQAASLGLTYEQVRCWFIERRRRRDKGEDKIIVSQNSCKELSAPGGRNLSGVTTRSIIKNAFSFSKYKDTSIVSSKICKKKKKHNQLQELLTTDYILQKVFRKDGPPVGVEFESPDHGNSYPACDENQRTSKRRKVCKNVINQTISNGKTSSARRHGIGKGLMTVWRTTNPHGGDFPSGIGFANREVVNLSPPLTSKSQKPRILDRRLKQRKLLNGSLRSKVPEKKKPSVKRKEVQLKKSEDPKIENNTKCELALEAGVSPESCRQIEMLVDDEELELSQIQAVSDQSSCRRHFAANGIQGASSKISDLLDKFPPNSVEMKQPLCVQPWESSPEIVSKLFKVFHFIYTYSLDISISPFTLDEFAQAFHDKDSSLLGKIHVALLKLLLCDVEAEVNSGLLPQLSKSCNFLVLLHSVENQDFVLEFWKRSLNPLTWTEILRQVLVAAGFGPNQGAICRESLSKEVNLMRSYGLLSGTLKGELFKILLEQGNDGLQVSELAICLQIIELKLASKTEELESLIASALSSDITLFEKISPSTYRLRINSVIKKVEAYPSDSEDSGAVDDNPGENGTYRSDEDYGDDAATSNLINMKYTTSRKLENNKLKMFTEIDESHPGEVWLLGLMEGEYSDLSIEEKLNALIALVDLLNTIRMEDNTVITEYIPNIHHSSLGGKIKRSTPKQQILLSYYGHGRQMHGVKDAYTCSRYDAIDSSTSISKFNGRSSGNGKLGSEFEVGACLHPMRSVFLGSDRRYNRYWLFLGPCNASDPGHRRVYFESSEDGRWEVIDTKEALCALLSVLDDRGKREALLIESLEKRKTYLCQAMSISRTLDDMEIRHLAEFDQSEQNMVREESSPVSDVDNNLVANIRNETYLSSGAVILELGKKGGEKNQSWSSIQEFDSWIWNSFYLNLNAVKHGKKSYFDSLTRCRNCHDLYWRDEKHCKICHTTFEIDFDLEERYAVHIATCREEEATDVFPKHKVLSSQIQSLKAALHAIESAMPEDSLVGAWTKSAHKLWVKRLRRTSSLSELLQVIADFVGAINNDWLRQYDVMQGPCDVGEEIITCFSSMPHTTSAVALWLVKLDSYIAPYLRRANSGKAAGLKVREWNSIF